MDKSIIFVCMGNICRSPAAEGVCLAELGKRGLRGQVLVDSAGTTAYHCGEPADVRMSEAAARRGYHLTSRARRFETSDFERFDLIIAMDRQNRRDLLSQAKGSEQCGRVHMLSEFLPSGGPVDCPDPYYGGASGFDEVLDMIETAMPAVLDQLLSSTESSV